MPWSRSRATDVRDRDAIEATLTPTLRAARVELRRLLNLADDDPALRVFDTAAVELIATPLRASGRAEFWDSYRLAAGELGLEPETIVSRINRHGKRRAA